MKSSLLTALEQVRHDVVRGTPIDLEVVDEPAVDNTSTDSFWLIGLHGTRTGVVVTVALQPSHLLASLAAQVQDFLHEELPGRGLPALWPECPLHPHSHPLSPEVGAQMVAVWLCP